MTSDLDMEQLKAVLGPSTEARQFVHLAETTSTQDVIRAAAAAGEPAGLVVIADHQTHGRGQFGRIWRDIPGQTLLCSLLLRPTRHTPDQTPALLLQFAHTLCGVIAEAMPDQPVRLKHPNDVVIDTPSGTKKLAGVIAEGAVRPDGSQWMAIGFGVNIGAAPTDTVDGVDLATASGAINTWAQSPLTRQALLAALFARYRL